MRKKLIFICGPNGVGKSSACRELVNCLEESADVDFDFIPIILTCALDEKFMLPYIKQ